MATKDAGGALPSGFQRPLERAFGMQTLGDLVGHLPRRYAKRGELTQLSSLVPGEHVTVVANVRSVEKRDLQRDAKGRPRTLTSITITDGTSELDLAFFNQAWRSGELHQGATALFSGSYVHEFVHDGRHLLGFPCH